MGKRRWNAGQYDIFSVEITFDDGSRKTWDYDALYFENLDDMKANMAADFAEPLANCHEAVLYVKNGAEYHTGVVELPDAVGLAFANYIFEHIGELV